MHKPRPAIAPTPPVGRAPDAILGVALFKEMAPSSFGRFNRAFVSMFRIAAGETWIEELPILDSAGDIFWKSSLFIFSFVILNVWVVLQVIDHLRPCRASRKRKIGREKDGSEADALPNVHVLATRFSQD